MLDMLLQEYNDVLADQLPSDPMAGSKMHIKLCEDIAIQPKKIFTSRPLPLHHEDQAKALIDQLLEEGIIEAIHEETCDWISPAFFVA